jgi:hypothetical protein
MQNLYLTFKYLFWHRNSSEGFKASLTIFKTKATIHFVFALCGYCCMPIQQDHQTINRDLPVDRGQLFGHSRPVVWSIAASCLVNRGQLFGQSRPFVWSIAARCLVNRGQLFGLYQNVFATSVRSITLRLTAFFGSNYLCEEAFSHMKIIKSRYRRRLTDERLKYCLHLCLRNYEPSFSKLLQDMQCHASTSQ